MSNDTSVTAPVSSFLRSLEPVALAIAHSNGFKTSAHFSRRFNEAYGRSPREVRHSGRPAVR